MAGAKIEHDYTDAEVAETKRPAEVNVVVDKVNDTTPDGESDAHAQTNGESDAHAQTNGIPANAPGLKDKPDELPRTGAEDEY